MTEYRCEVVEADSASRAAAMLFERCFRLSIPGFPRHFELRADGGPAIGYVHFTRLEAGVYLCGGLCVDAWSYRKCSHRARSGLRNGGTWSRQLLRESIELLGSKRAVFAYSGNAVSVRDIGSLGFVDTVHGLLYVQWHSAVDPAERAELVERAFAVAPF